MKVLDENGLAVLKQYLLAELPLINPSDWEQLTSPGTATIYKLKVINNQLVAPLIDKCMQQKMEKIGHQQHMVVH